MRQHLLHGNADATANAVRANQVVANAAISADIGGIAERLEADGKLAVLALERIAPKCASLAIAFEKASRFSVAERHRDLLREVRSGFNRSGVGRRKCASAEPVSARRRPDQHLALLRRGPPLTIALVERDAENRTVGGDYRARCRDVGKR